MITENSFALPLECYGRLKSNRIVYYQGQKLSLSELSVMFKKNSFNHKHGAYIKAIEVYLKGFGEINLLLVRNDNHDEPGKTKFLFSTHLFDSAPKILLRYRSRWAIETAFRDLKQNLNLASCQATSLVAQQSHIALSLFAFVLLELLPQLQFQQQIPSSIGEKKRFFSQFSLFSNEDKSRFSILNFSIRGATFTPLEDSELAQVTSKLYFAYQSLLIPLSQSAA